MIPKQEYADKHGRVVVLVIDDNPMVREIGARMLEFLGLETLEAEDGVEAVEVFRKHHGKICYILCDLTMPRMDGWETLAALRRIDPGIPAILASGYDPVQAQGGTDNPERFQAFLSKPYQMADLQDALGKCRQRSVLDS